jgi:hypothetical protein
MVWVERQEQPEEEQMVLDTKTSCAPAVRLHRNGRPTLLAQKPSSIARQPHVISSNFCFKVSFVPSTEDTQIPTENKGTGAKKTEGEPDRKVVVRNPRT